MNEKRNRRLAAIGILVTTTTFVAIVCWLHVVRPDLDPARTGVSRYAAGDHGYAVTVGFALLSLAMLIAASRSAGTSRHSLAIGSAGLALVAFLPLRSPAPGFAEYLLHQAGGAVFFVAGTVGALRISSTLRAVSAHAPLRLAARVSAVTSTIALALFFGSVVARASLLGSALGGFQRLCFAAICTSLASLGLDMLRQDRERREPQAHQR